MNTSLVDKIVNAVLYEGYLLYPYRPSSVKNNQRWNFGVVYPRAYAESQSGADSCTMQTECLVTGGQSSVLDIGVRFLRLIERTAPNGSWQEASECTLPHPDIPLQNLLAAPITKHFHLPAVCAGEHSPGSSGNVVRTQAALDGSIEASAEQLHDSLYRVRVRISNLTSLDSPQHDNRERALLQSFASTHTVLTVAHGEFISLLDPGVEFRAAAAQCCNLGAWPVLVGTEGQRDTLLSSPIILYDYPQIAPESPGDLFDGTEIDEILSLRILTMTDEEKREMRGFDPRARRILERTESLPEERFLKLHGALRGLAKAGAQ